MTYLDNFLKGIPNSTFLIERNKVATHLFFFNQVREDGALQQSINWEDDKNAIDFTLLQTKPDGDLQFKSGIAQVPIREIDKLNMRPTVNGVLSYEREPLPENKYHGNLIIMRRVKKPQMRQIAAGIALAVSKVIQNP